MRNTEKDDTINRSENILVVLAGGLGQIDQCLCKMLDQEEYP